MSILLDQEYQDFLVGRIILSYSQHYFFLAKILICKMIFFKIVQVVLVYPFLYFFSLEWGKGIVVLQPNDLH